MLTAPVVSDRDAQLAANAFGGAMSFLIIEGRIPCGMGVFLTPPALNPQGRASGQFACRPSLLLPYAVTTLSLCCASPPPLRKLQPPKNKALH